MNTAMPAFSYAQAARGLAPTKDKETSTEQAPKPAPKPESNTSQPPSRSSRSRGREEQRDTDNTTKPASTPSSLAADAVEKENVPPKRPSQSVSESTPSSATSPHLNGIIGSPAEKDTTQQLDHSESWEKASHASTTGDKEPAIAQKEKAKETEDEWEKVSVPSISGDKEKDKEKELKPAAPPPVNFWAARKQAQEAKLRDLQTQRTAAASLSAPPSAASRPKASMEAPKNKGGPKDAPEKESMADSRRSHESGRGNERIDMASSQRARPASHHGDKDDTAAAPAVNDVTSWPTPENAIVDDRRKSGAQDKSEGRSNGTKAHGKQWVTMPFVPTAKFETQLPPAAARRGARSGRGQGMSRGAHASNASNTGDRQDTGGAMPPPPLPKHAAEQDRGRKPESGHGGRSSSLPTGSRRATSRESATNSTHKPSGRDSTAQPVATPGAAPDTDPTHNQRMSNFSSHTPSRSSSRHEGQNTMMAPNGDLTTSQITAESVADPFTIPTSDASIRSNYLPDRSKPTHSSFRSSGDPARERAPPRNRDFSREKSDAAREKVESWRDREFSGETGYRRESRPERGRGSYRGRGNHPANYQSSHAYTSPLPQNGFEIPKTPSGQESRSRQSSQPFMTGMPQQQTSRGIPRSQSIPVGTMYPGYYNNAAGVPQALSPLQTDMSTYGYPPQMQMQPSIMSAMPYNDPLNSYAMYSMVMTQVEYYFSIDNLCKDLYLRKNMDSQGWVPLTIIANFKRIRTLTDDSMPLETLKHVCQQVKSVEWSRGEDGKDRLRRREGWEDFVLDMHERFPAAQNDGPSTSAQPAYGPMMAGMVSSEGMPFVPPQARSPSAAVPMNGVYNPPGALPYGPVPSLDGHGGEQAFQDSFIHQMQDQSRRESTTSPLSQVDQGLRQPMPFSPKPRPIGGMINGHRRQVSRNFNEENIFPDDAIASINICVREPPPDVQDEDQNAKPVLNRVLSNESQSTNADVPPVSIPSRVSGLRGGAASPEQLARLQGMRFGFSSSQATATEGPAFYSKEGEQTQMPPVKPGQYFVSYNALHESSLQQREQGIEGAMKPMYSFWANFLVDKFNDGMYSEFKRTAEADLNEGDTAGVEHLLSYYRGALKSSAALSEHVAQDLVASLREEKDVGRPFFKMMRMAWRDGALNLKTRKRIGDLLKDEEKSQFDRGG